VSLAGGTAALPITDPAARAMPLAPTQWRAMLRNAVPLSGGLQSGSAQGTVSAVSDAAHSSGDMRPNAAGSSHCSGGHEAAAEPQRPGYSSRPPLGPDGAPSSGGVGSGQSWRSLGRSSAPSAVSTSDAPASPDALSASQSQTPAFREADDAAAAARVGDAQRRGVVVLDVRNGYEWDAGHFVGAERPAEARMPLVMCYTRICRDIRRLDLVLQRRYVDGSQLSSLLAAAMAASQRSGIPPEFVQPSVSLP